MSLEFLIKAANPDQLHFIHSRLLNWSEVNARTPGNVWQYVVYVTLLLVLHSVGMWERRIVQWDWAKNELRHCVYWCENHKVCGRWGGVGHFVISARADIVGAESGPGPRRGVTKIVKIF